MNVRPKKAIGQHLLKDNSIALKIVESLLTEPKNLLIEIGPGMGVLTKFLLSDKHFAALKVVEIDHESVEYLLRTYPELTDRIIYDDFLSINLAKITSSKISLIGNLPYNISSQILFRVLENRDQVTQVVCMIQKEVAERISSVPHKKAYGILSVFLQAYYTIEYLFTVPPDVFIPPPKVDSAVIRMVRNDVKNLGCDEKLFHRIVKTAFNQRRKTMRNSLRALFSGEIPEFTFSSQRPEELSVEEFVELTNQLKSYVI
jgi:16S rRNA (adenine1518-N6/adenine1519-N6)-dimethyltransferase